MAFHHQLENLPVLPLMFGLLLTGNPYHPPWHRAVDQTKPNKTYAKLFGTAEFRHWDSVIAVGFSGCGEFAISGSRDKTVRIWSIKTKQEMMRYNFSQEIDALAVATNTTTLVVADGNGLWAIDWTKDRTPRLVCSTGTEKTGPLVVDNEIRTVAVSGNGLLAAVGFANGEVRVFDLLNAQETCSVKNYRNEFFIGLGRWPLVLTADGRRLIFAARDNNLHVWDIAKGKEVRTLEGHEKEITNVVISPDDRMVMSASMDKTVRIWELATGKIRKQLDTGSECFCLALSADGKLLATDWETDWEACVYGLPSFTVVGKIKSPPGGFASFALSPNGSKLLAGTEHSALQIWDVKTGNLANFTESHQGYIVATAVSPDDTMMVTASYDHTLRLWSLTSGKMLHVLRGHSGKVGSAAFSPDGKRVISASWDGTVRFWDVESGKETLKLSHDKHVCFVGFAHGGKWLVSYGSDGRIRCWETSTCKECFSLECATDAHRLLCAPNGLELVAIAQEEIRIWNLQTKELRCIKKPLDYDSQAAYSPDGVYLASVSILFKLVRLYHLASGSHESISLGKAGDPNCVAFSKDGKFLIVGTSHGSLVLLDIKTKKVVCTRQGDGSPILCVSMSHSGVFCVTGHANSTAALWNLAEMMKTGQ
jgi:WD40 repeat protein